MQSIVRDDPLTGRTLGEFVVTEQIGEGGFGLVYRAEQPQLAREAVIKVLHRRHRNSAMVPRFLQEARIASRLDHPYAAHIYAFGAEPDGLVWIAMEMVRGTPLSTLLREGPLPLGRFVPLFDRIAEVIAAAHEQGIVHRDIKPSNVMVVTRAGRLLPKLLDFGIAKLSGETSSELQATAASGDADTIASGPSATHTNALLGTPQYMAPELWQDSRAANSLSDLYALGVLCYESLTGRLPFEAPDLRAMACAHAFDPVPPIGAPLPLAVGEVIARALAKKPTGRFPTALELAAALRTASGLGDARSALPALDEAVREATLLGAPRPLADAVAALEAATSSHQARDCAFRVVDVAAHWLGILALASYSRMGTVVDSEVGEALRGLRRRRPTTTDWIELASALTAAVPRRRALHPVPELVDAFASDGSVVGSLRALVELRASAERGQDSESAVQKLLQRLLPELATLLRSMAFLAHYPLIVPRSGFVERWMGVRRGRPAAEPALDRTLAEGQPVLVDRDGAPALQLAPLVQVAPPVAGTEDELFLFDGPGRHGAKLVALPNGFERYDETLWKWFGTHLLESRDSESHDSMRERPPYRGLAAFTAEDASTFFGREQEAVALLNRLRIAPFLAVVGPSGAGKTSLVHAGVLPELPAGWRAIALRPGGTPMHALRSALVASGIPIDTDDPAAIAAVVRSAQATRGETLVLVIDQLEELFTLGADDITQHRFAETLAEVARSPDDRVRVVATLRDDFLMAAEQLSPLRTRLAQGVALVGSPQPADLRRILVEPLRRAGYDFEDPGLPDEMVREVAGQPAALPLLSFAAAQLWELRDRQFRQLTRKAYATLGGVGGALAAHAEEVLAGLLHDQQRLLRTAFQHLVTAEGTRAVMTRAELVDVLGGAAGAAVIERLLAARLLIAESRDGSDRIEIVHEALLQAWPRLVAWRREDLEGARLRDQLRAAARQWDERGRPRGLLWREDALAEYVRWRARHPAKLGALEEAFASASVGAAAKGRRTRSMLLGAAFTVLAAVSVVLYGMNRREVAARAEAHHGLVRGYIEQGRTALLGGRHWEALDYLTRALGEGADSPGLALMRGLALMPARAMIYRIHPHAGEIANLQFSPDGARFVTAGQDGAALWDTSSGHLVHRLTENGERAFDAAFNASGSRVAIGGGDGAVRLWDTSDGRLVQTLRGHTARVMAVAFSPDGLRLASSGPDGHVRIWDLEQGKAAFVLDLPANADSRIFDLHWGPKLLAGTSLDRAARVWDPTTGRLTAVLTHENAVASARFDRRGERLVTASSDRTVRIWQMPSGKMLRVLYGSGDRLDYADFSPDGSDVVGAARDGTARIWNAATGALRASLRGRRGTLWYAEYDRSGERLLTAGDDGVTRIWNAKNGHLVAALEGHTNRVPRAHFSPDSTRVISGSSDGTVALWNPAEPYLQKTWSPLSSWCNQIGRGQGRLAIACPQETRAWSVDGSAIGASSLPGADLVAVGRKRIVTANGAVATVWPIGGSQKQRTLSASEPIKNLAVTADDRLLAAGAGNIVHLWNLDDGRELARLDGHAGGVSAVALSADGGRLATAAAAGVVRVRSTSDPSVLCSFDAPRPPTFLEFSRSGDLLAAATDAESPHIVVADVRSGRTVATLQGLHAGMLTMHFNRSGDRLLAANQDGTAALWELPSGRLVSVFAGESQYLADVVFDASERLLIAVDGDGDLRFYDAATVRPLGVIDGLGTPGGIVEHIGPSTAAVVGAFGGLSVWNIPLDHSSADELRHVLATKSPFGQ